VILGSVLAVTPAGCSGNPTPEQAADPSSPASATTSVSATTSTPPSTSTSSQASTFSPAPTSPSESDSTSTSSAPPTPSRDTSTTSGSAGPLIPLIRYEEPTLGFSIAYPKGWRLTETAGVGHAVGGDPIKSVGLCDPTGNRDGDVLLEGVAVSVFKLGVVVNAELVPTFREKVEDRVSLLRAGLSRVETIEGLRDTSIDGAPAFETTFRFTADGRRMRTRLVFVVSGDLEYQLTAQASDASYEVSRPRLDQVIASFRLVG